MPPISRRTRLLILALLILGLLATPLAAPILAQTGGGYDLTWSTIDDGGGTSSGGGYSLSATIGQPDSALAQGSGYTLKGGFWVEAVEGSTSNLLFLPRLLR